MGLTARTGRWVSSALAVWLVLLAAVALMYAHQCDDEDCRSAATFPLILLFAAAVAGTLLLVFFVVSAIRMRQLKAALNSTFSPVILSGCLTLSLLAAVPVNARWDDGCNDHDATLPLISSVRVWLSHPEHSYVAYEDVSDALYCSSA